MPALTIQAPAVARTSVGNSSARWAAKAGAKAEEPRMDRKIPTPMAQPVSEK